MSNLCPKIVWFLSKDCKCPSLVQVLLYFWSFVNVLSKDCPRFVQILLICPIYFTLDKTLDTLLSNSCPTFVQTYFSSAENACPIPVKLLSMFKGIWGISSWSQSWQPEGVCPPLLEHHPLHMVKLLLTCVADCHTTPFSPQTDLATVQNIKLILILNVESRAPEVWLV